MMNELKTVSEFAENNNLFAKGTLVLCAVSGGVDSMCLLRLMEELSEQRGFRIAVIHFNHRLRGAESDRDECFVRDFCADRGIDFYSGSGDVSGYACEKAVSIETAARKLRYDFFEAMANKLKASAVATAHNADDNAETVLLNLTRGTGINGLTGIPPIRGIYVRPMLRLSRNEIEKYLSENYVPHVEDSTNAGDDYTRNRLRHGVVPLLKAINPSFAAGVASMTELLAADRKYLDRTAEKMLSDKACGRLPIELINSQDIAISSRIVKLSMERMGFPVDYAHITAILRLAKYGGPSDEVSLPGGKAYREYETLVLSRQEHSQTELEERRLVFGENIIPEIGMMFTLTEENEKIHNTFNTFCFKKASICGNITIRSRHSGDKITFCGRNGTRNLKKLFIDEKIPVRDRAAIPVFVDKCGVIAVWGFGVAERCRPEPQGATIKLVGENISE